MPALTLSQLRTRLSQLIGDPDNQRFTASEKTDKLNEAQERFSLDTGAYRRYWASDIVSGTRIYNLPSSLRDILRVTVNNIALSRTSREELDETYRLNDWTDDTGRPTYYFIEIETDYQRLVLYPIPTSEYAGTENLVVESSMGSPDAMTSDSGYPFTGSLTQNTLFNNYHMALAYWAAAEFMKILPDNQALVMAKTYEDEYQKFVNLAIEHLLALSLKTPLRFRGGRYYKNP